MNQFFKIILFGVILLLSVQTLYCGCYVSDPTRKWPSSRIPYKIDPTLPNPLPLQMEAVHVAAAYLSAVTNLCFVEATPHDTAYILVRERGSWGGCSANTIGFSSSAAISCSSSVPTICHEFMHVLGFQHEQRRPDRDDHIIVYEDCITSNYIGQYTKLPASAYSVSPVYDYHSVMHYRNTLGAIWNCAPNGNITMESLNFPNVQMSQNSFLSPIDVESINALYPEVCDDCSELTSYPYNFNGKYNIVGDGWGDPLVPFAFNLNSDIEITSSYDQITTFEGSLYMSSTETITLLPDVYMDGYDTYGNEATMCLEIQECNASSASKTILENGMNSSKKEFKIYPNPVTDWTNLSVNSKVDEDVEIEILDLNGQVLKSIDSNYIEGQESLRINMSELQTGVYLLRVSGEDWSETQKVFKN